ncbi:MAG TPA: peptidyl-prolyl cis-trans isomerase [Gemmatimonadales bacterium]|nr:peptidyl-prolyl cis-trans isomerase [Gemmatimonadales bacterium]
MMRSMRENSKYIFYVLAIAFIGWLVFDVGMGVTGAKTGGDVVLKIDGTEIHYPEWQQAVAAARDQYVARGGSSSLTDDEQKQLEDQVVDQLTQDVALQHAYSRLGISVSDQDVIDAARTSPPPEVMQAPDFQTNGQFDMNKWLRFLASGSSAELMLQLEARYRQVIPQQKLAEYLTADVYVPDAKLWRIWRDQHDTVTTAMVALQAVSIPDTAVKLTDQDIQAYYAAHQTDFKRPAIAYTTFLALPRAAEASDTAAALALARKTRPQVAVSESAFARVAKQLSVDTISGARGGDLGWIHHDESGFDPAFMAGLKNLKPGQVSEPVLSQFGYHLIRVDQAAGDSVKVRHILFPIALSGPRLDLVEARADTLDRLAAEHDDGKVIDSLGKTMHLNIAQAPPLYQGDRMTLGKYVVPDVGSWAFGGARSGQTSKVIEGERAFYVFRLDSLTPAGIPPLAEVRPQIERAARFDRKKEMVRQQGQALAAKLAGATDFKQAASAAGYAVTVIGPFTRLRPPPQIQLDPEVIGAAFALAPGERSPLIEGRTGDFLLQGVARTKPDSQAWLAQRDQQRTVIVRGLQQARVTAYVAALKAKAKVVDRRKELFQQTQAAGS